MVANYQLRLKDDLGNLVALIDDYRTLTFSKIVNEQGSLTLTMNGKDAKVSLFGLDGQLEVWRRDIATGVDGRGFSEHSRTHTMMMGITSLLR